MSALDYTTGIGATGPTGPAGATGPTGSGGSSLIFDQILGAAGASLDTGAIIPATYDSLLVIARLRVAATGLPAANARMFLNEDTDGPYNIQYVRAANTTLSGFSFVGQSQIQVICATSGNKAGIFGLVVFRVVNYAEATFTELEGTSTVADGTAAANSLAETWGANYESNNAIDRIRISGWGTNLEAGSRLTVYGV